MWWDERKWVGIGMVWKRRWWWWWNERTRRRVRKVWFVLQSWRSEKVEEIVILNVAFENVYLLAVYRYDS